MKKIFLLLSLFTLSLSLYSLKSNISPPIYNTSQPAKKYILDLDKTPLEMWREVVSDYKSIVAPFV